MEGGRGSERACDLLGNSEAEAAGDDAEAQVRTSCSAAGHLVAFSGVRSQARGLRNGPGLKASRLGTQGDIS